MQEGKRGTGLQVLLGLIVLAALASVLSNSVWAQNAEHKAWAMNGGNANLVARGQYIVNDVAVCSQCHTPRDDRGRVIRSRWLEGAPVWFQPAANTSDWPLKAPRLAGTPPASETDMVKLLTTGLWTNGKELRPPMPQFRMSREDAEAVIAYLKSLNPEAQR
jgi:mono/diheme cytochrome c family protein